jgi:hypothetical protein
LGGTPTPPTPLTLRYANWNVYWVTTPAVIWSPSVADPEWLIPDPDPVCEAIPDGGYGSGSQTGSNPNYRPMKNMRHYVQQCAQ